MTAPDWLNLKENCLSAELSLQTFFSLMWSNEVARPCSTQSSRAFSFDVIKWSGLPLLNKVFRRSVLWCHQAPKFMFIVETLLILSAYSRVKQVHFGNNNCNVMFVQVLKSSMFTGIMTYIKWITSQNAILIPTQIIRKSLGVSFNTILLTVVCFRNKQCFN